VQFYNNYCGVQSYVARFDTKQLQLRTWDTWAKQTSLNKNVKVFLGVPANSGAAGFWLRIGIHPRRRHLLLQDVLQLGGVMMWMLSQAYANQWVYLRSCICFG